MYIKNSPLEPDGMVTLQTHHVYSTLKRRENCWKEFFFFLFLIKVVANTPVPVTPNTNIKVSVDLKLHLRI